MTRFPNSEVVAELPAARNIYRKAVEIISEYYASYGKLTFENVQTIATMFVQSDTARHVALVRIIECENIITLEV